MGNTRRKPESAPRRGRPPATPQDRNNQLINMSYELAEKQFKDGTASSQVTTHFLKMGSEREALELERLTRENELLKARVDQIESQANMENLAADAIRAFRGYQGQHDDFDDVPDYDL